MSAPPAHPLYPWEIPPTPRPTPVNEPDPEPDRDEVERLAAREIWRVLPSRHPPGGALEPLSANWFKHLDEKRYRRHGRWVPQLLEFARHADESVLAVGDGLGLDWVRFADGGAHVSVVDPSSDRLRLYRRHFTTRGASAQYLHAPHDRLPAGDNRIDVVCAVFNDAPATPWRAILAEAFRVLRPGGKMMAVLPAYYDATRWQAILRPWRRWFRRQSAPVRVGFTGKELRAAFADFTDIRVYKRHVRRAELPYLWRWMLLPVVERLMGRFLVVKGFKPLTAVAAARAAA